MRLLEALQAFVGRSGDSGSASQALFQRVD